MLNEKQKQTLVATARAAVTLSFLTKEGGVRYGAAVLTVSGRIYQAGQYSSFNHSTNVHAECGALLSATMAGDPDVIALAVASNGNDPVTRPCGVCRQVMLEHATRTGRDFEVLMAGRETGWESNLVSELLPFAWRSANQSRDLSSSDSGRPRPAGGVRPSSCLAIRTGDQVRLRGGVLALVWDPLPWTGSLLLKLKYHERSDGGWSKFSHAFSQPTDYEQELADVPGVGSAPCGAPVACVPRSVIEEVYPALKARGTLSATMLACLEEAGLDPARVEIGGSRATGMAMNGSDLDLVVRGEKERLSLLHVALAKRLRVGDLRVPAHSGTWRTLHQIYPGGQEAILDRGLFAQTFEEEGQSVALMLCPDVPPSPIYAKKARFGGLVSVFGMVVESGTTLFKRSHFQLHRESGTPLEIVSFHKAANLLRTGDHIALRGWLVNEEGRELILQFHPHRENVIWFPSDSFGQSIT